MGQLGQHFCLAPLLLGLSLHALVGIKLSRPFIHELLNERGSASDDEKEGAQQPSERQPTAQYFPWPQALPRGQICERWGEVQPPAATRKLRSCLPVQRYGRLPACLIARQAPVLRRPCVTIIERAPLRRGRLVFDPQHDALSR